MSETIEQKKNKRAESLETLLLVVVMGVNSLSRAWDYELPDETLLVIGAATALINYRQLPPAERSARRLFDWLLLVFAFYLAFWKVPPLLEQWMPGVAAYLLALLMFAALVMVMIRKGAFDGVHDASQMEAAPQSLHALAPAPQGNPLTEPAQKISTPP